MFKFKVKVLNWFVLCIFVMSVLISGCGAGNTAGDTTNTASVTTAEEKVVEPVAKVEKVKLRVATFFATDSIFQPLIDKFTEENKDTIELVYEHVQGDEMRTKIKVDAAGGNTPDFFDYWGPYALLGPLVKGGIALDVDEFFAKSTVTKKSDWDQSAIDVFTSPIDSKTYGIPFSGFLGYFLVNKTMFEKYGLEYPKTWDDFIAVSKVFNDNGIIPFSMTSKGGNPSHFYFSYLYGQLAGSREELAIDLKGNYKFDTQNCLKIAKLIDEQRKLKMFPADTIANGDWNPSFALFVEKKAAMIFSYPWMLGTIPEEMYDEIEYIDMPKLTDAAYDPATFVSKSGNDGFIISKDSFHDPKKQAALIKLVDFYCSDEYFTEAVKDGRYISKNINVDKSLYSPMLTRLLEFSEGKDGVGNHYTSFPDSPAFNMFQTTLDELWAGTISPEDFVTKVQAELDRAEK